MTDITREDLRELRDEIRISHRSLEHDIFSGISRLETQLVSMGERVRKTELDLVVLQARHDEGKEYIARTAARWGGGIGAGIGGTLWVLLEVWARWLN